jgi:hypothetical protein
MAGEATAADVVTAAARAGKSSTTEAPPAGVVGPDGDVRSTERWFGRGKEHTGPSISLGPEKDSLGNPDRLSGV